MWPDNGKVYIACQTMATWDLPEIADHRMEESKMGQMVGGKRLS